MSGEPAATGRMLHTESVFTNPPCPPYLAPFLVHRDSLEVGNLKRAALYTVKPSDPFSEKLVGEPDDTQDIENNVRAG